MAEDVFADSGQLKSPILRVDLRYRLASVIWEKDEKRAREIYSAAIDEARSLIGNAAVKSNQEETTDDFYPQNNGNDYDLARLREEIILSISKHDPKMALDALNSLALPPDAKKLEEYDPLGNEDALALTLSAALAEKDPQKAFDLIKRGLRERFPENVNTVLNNLQKDSPELAAKLSVEILGRLRSTAGTSNNATATEGKNSQETDEVNMWSLGEFFNSVAKSYDATKVKKGEKLKPLLSEADARELASIIAGRVSKEKSSLTYQLGNVYEGLQKFAPTQAAALRRQVPAAETEQFNTLVQMLNSEENEVSLDDAIKAAEKTPANERDSKYSSLASRAMEEGNLEKAQELYAKIVKKDDYKYISNAIKKALPYANAEKADIAETRRNIADIGSTSEKIRALANLASALAAAKRIKDAEQIAGEAAALMPADTRRLPRLQAVYDIAKGFAQLDAERSFSLIEGTVSQANDLINASALLEEFNTGHWTNYDEFTYDAMKRVHVATIYDSTPLILTLGQNDFERTVGLAERIGRADARVYAKFRIVNSFLDASAAENERKQREEFEQMGHEH